MKGERLKRAHTWAATAVLLFAAVPSTPLAAEPPVPTPQPVINLDRKPVTQPTRASRSRRELTSYPKAWQRLAWCESRFRLHANNNNTYFGLWQIHKGWFKPFGINPRTATIEQQWKVAQVVYRKQGARAWSCAGQAKLK